MSLRPPPHSARRTEPRGRLVLHVRNGLHRPSEVCASWINALMVASIILGCLIDGISMAVRRAAVVMPAVKAAGIEVVWFGIFVVLVVEMAQIALPAGFNLYVPQGLTNKPMGYIALLAQPFFLAMMGMGFLIILLPDLVTWLPNQMLGQK